MSDEKWPVSRRGFLGAVGSGTLLALSSAQAASRSPKLDDPPIANVTVMDDVDVEMRDGTVLSADVYLPDPEDGSEEARTEYPTLLKRTPYNKAFSATQGEGFAKHGYAVVVQDVRGKYASEGDFYPYRSEDFAEAEDGYDTVEWAADQDWSNGKVGTFGISYHAATQWALTHNAELPPHLETMTPGFAVASYYGQGAYAGGAPLLSHNMDVLLGLFGIPRFNRDDPDRDELESPIPGEEELTFLEEAQAAIPQLYWDLPVVPFEPLQEAGLDWFEDWHTNEIYNDYWEPQDNTLRYDEVDIPVLNYGGWYDIFNQGTVWNFQGLREESDAPEGAALVMGPYTHGNQDLRAQGTVMGSPYLFPENSTLDEMALRLSWFDRVLKEGKSTAESPSVRLYVPGLDEWIGAESFPPEATEFRNYYLHSDGGANVGNVTDTNYDYEGVLSTEATSSQFDAPTDEYTYDPADPVVTGGGYNTHWEGGVNDRATAYHRREDVLVYETAVLDEDVAVVGPITATLFASTSAVDTDFVVTLSDVDPLATAGGLRVAEGARRGRIGDVSGDPRETETYAEVNELEPGEVYEWKIAVWPTARVFEAGRRIRIDVTSSDVSRYARNLNTGAGLTGTEMRTADQTIYHSEEYPSNVELPIVPTSELEAMVIDGPVPGRENDGIAPE
jgi:putative CocE/NonD family hydrolase